MGLKGSCSYKLNGVLKFIPLPGLKQILSGNFQHDKAISLISFLERIEDTSAQHCIKGSFLAELLLVYEWLLCIASGGITTV